MPVAVPPNPPISPWGEKVFPPTWKLSEWQRTTRDDPLVNMGRDDALPERSEVVIIGSGLAGTKTAHSLLTSPNPPKSITIIEAREACSGASGRNAGHCRPDAFRGFTAFSKIHGKEEAGKIIKSEGITLASVKEFVEEHSVECEFTPRQTLDVILNEDFKQYCAMAYDEAKEYGLDLSHIKYHDQEDAKKVTRSPHALGAYEWPAASLNPAKLCYAIHHVNFSLAKTQGREQNGYKLFTWTPVTAVVEAESSADDEEYKWEVKTTRGNVLAQKVVFATNGYTSLVLPELDGLITSMKAEAIKLNLPPVGLDEFPRIEPTMSLRYLDRFYSVMQRPDNSIVLAAPRKWPGQFEATAKSLYGTYDDSDSLRERAQNAYGSFAKIVPNGGYSAERMVEGEDGLDYAWSGILGLTPDSVPFVGPVPEKEGQYIIAGFNGHGMARIFHCAPTLAAIMTGGEWDPTLPLAFKSSPERFASLREKIGKSGEVSIHKELEEKANNLKI
ncbi:hypothetical protein CI109_104305 [Kwoniella shandongensis]|uniref:FAD dependent oxidoreductase domain-containing protein n=1 Tax=Kwoniella shandongensis TaxID=1734106 RepID=A0A5M6C0H5_9TREE|nr:uncharacterized protein CI109_002791 [Kwoniella shandongensis]KAA5528637.1 hypothetical protein CI109_002791 [Kwoniella shandongensis]